MEDYEFAWYFAAYHTVIDSFEKRGKKGVLITIGDEPVHKHVSRHCIKYYFGDDPEKDLTSTEILKKASEKWDIYHIHINHGYYHFEDTNWQQMLDTHAIPTESGLSEEVKRIIPAIVIQSYKDFNDLIQID